VTARPASPPVVEAYGNFLERQGRTADASALYNKAVSIAGLQQMAQAGLARIAAGKKPDPIIRTTEDGAAEALFSIGAGLSDPESAEISIFYLRMTLYLRPDFGLAEMVLAARYESLQKFQDAEAIYAGIDKSSEYYRAAAVDAALDRERLGEKDEAIRALKSLAEADAGDSDTWITLGDAYRESGKADEAIDAYDHAQKALPTLAKSDWTLFYARAIAEEKAHHWDKAEADIDTGLKLSPDQPELLNYLGYSWVDQGRRIPEALAMLEKARAMRPTDGYIVDSVGWAYYRLGRYEEAAQTLQAAILLVPGDSTINDHLGDALWKAGQKMDARFQWNHALTFSEDADEKASITQKLKTGLTG
jgi:tetratricopeptide (TPR) repeat protein